MAKRQKPAAKKKASTKELSRGYLSVTVFVTGMSIMVLELMGSRVIGPYYGVSLYVWASLIATALIALALGYWLGGRVADKKGDPNLLYGFIVLAALLTVLIPVLRKPVLTLMSPMGVRFGALGSAIILFLLPVGALGTVSPYAVRLHARTLESVGSSAGNLYAISTIGSVLGTLLTGFVLIPSMAMNHILYGLGVLLAATAGVYWLSIKRFGRASATLVIILVFMTLLPSGGTSLSKLRRLGILLHHQKETPYGSLKIVDISGIRYMLLNGSFQGEMSLETGLSTSAYIHLMVAACHEYVHEAGRVLSIGLGGGCLATMLQELGMTVDTVEIDGDVIRAAERFFSYDTGKGSVIREDGRRYLQTTRERYDVVLLDAFASEAIPEHLLTAECFTQCKQLLGEKGLIAVNLVGFSTGPSSQVLRAVFQTVQTAFPHAAAWWIEQPGDPDPFGNLVILASRSELTPVDLADRMKQLGNISDQTLAGISLLPWPGRGPDPILTDQFNPVAAWNTATDLKIRRKLLEYLPSELLIG